MISPDHRVPSCGIPMTHDSHVFHVMANQICWTVQCAGRLPRPNPIVVPKES